MGDDFFTRWRFDHEPDPTSGHVVYVDYETALLSGLVNATADRVYMSADRTTQTGGGGRRSIRVRSKDAFDSGLFIVSVDHVPTGCSTWPAFWMYGEDAQHPWPTRGEYDVIEVVNVQDRVMSTLHTSEGCDQSQIVAGQDMSGTWVAGSWKERATNCYVHADGQYDNQGCIQQGPSGSIGPTFNKRGGGTYAAEWAPQHGHIRTWFWPRGQEPTDVTEGEPSPDLWGVPYSYFRLGAANCPQEHFKQMRLMFDLSFCGDWAGGTFPRDCPWLAKQVTCEELVANHPEELQEAYWSLRRLDVYSWRGKSRDEKEASDSTESKESQESGGGTSWWHLVICSLIVMQSVVLCGIGIFVHRTMLARAPREEDAEKDERSRPSSPTRPLVLGPASPQHQQPPIRMQAGPSQMARSMALSRAFSAPQRLGPNQFHLGR